MLVTGVWREETLDQQLRLAMSRLQVRARARSRFSITMPRSSGRRWWIAALAGSLEPGWSVEAYRGGDLVRTIRPTRRALRITFRVRYGENPVDFVAYGPFGEIREFNRTYRVLTELLPARRFEYGLSAGRLPAAVLYLQRDYECRPALRRHGAVDRAG